MHYYINKITLLHQVGISNYFMRKMHGQTTLKDFNLSKYEILLKKANIKYLSCTTHTNISFLFFSKEKFVRLSAVLLNNRYLIWERAKLIHRCIPCAKTQSMFLKITAGCVHNYRYYRWIWGGETLTELRYHCNTQQVFCDGGEVYTFHDVPSTRHSSSRQNMSPALYVPF